MNNVGEHELKARKTLIWPNNVTHAMTGKRFWCLVISELMFFWFNDAPTWEI